MRNFGKIFKKNKPREENPYVKIFEHTVEYCRKARFPVYKPVKYSSNADELMDANLLIPAEIFNNPALVVANIDSFDMARNMDANEKIMVLNLASDTISGGGVRRGARAQE